MKLKNVSLPSTLNNIVPSSYLADTETTPRDVFKSKVAKQISKIKEPVPRYFESVNQINGYWSEGEYDLIEIFKLLKFESYFFKATQKKQSLLTKSGFEVHSDNDEVKEYLDARFSLMELQTDLSLKALIEQLSFYLIVCSNAFVIKTRDKDFQFANSYKIDNKEIYPVSGLFLVHPTSLKPRYKWEKFRDGIQVKHKLVLDAWVYVNKRGAIVQFEPEDVVHFTLFKEEGMTLGTPEVVSVIDDIRTLRKMEEDVQLLLYRDLFPILHYSVEDPSMIDHASGTTELDQAKRDLERMMQDGGIATDARHKINYIGAQGKHIEVRPYLEYFQNRVFSGLGVSAADLGMGADISGNTAQSMSKQLLDSARYIQQEITRQFDECILKEMILQSPFGVNGLRKENRPSLRFEEIDIEWKIRTENHAADQFTKGALTIDEVRNQRGMKTLSDEHLKRTFHHMYGDQNPQAVAEREAKINKLETSAKKDLIKSSGTNSNVTKSTRKKVRDSVASDFILNKDISLQLLDIVDRHKENHPIGAKFNIKIETLGIYDSIKKNIFIKFGEGIQDASSDLDADPNVTEAQMKAALAPILDSVTSLSKSVSEELVLDINKNTSKALRRVDSANKTEQVKAYNVGYAMVAKANNVNTFSTYHYDSDDIIGTLTADTIDDVLPKHPNSKTLIKVVKNSDSVVDTFPTIDAVKEIVAEVKSQDLIDMVTPLEDKLNNAISNIEALKSTVTAISDGTQMQELNDSGLLDKLNRNTNNQIKMFLNTISDMKDQNSNIATQYIGAIQAIADSIPKTIQIDNPPMDINLLVSDVKVEKEKTSREVEVIRDKSGKIISAKIKDE